MRLTNILKWAATLIEDHSGKVSIKRFCALLLVLTVCTLILKITFGEDLKIFKWDSTVLLIGTVLAAVFTLLGISAYEKKQVLTAVNKVTNTDAGQA